MKQTDDRTRINNEDDSRRRDQSKRAQIFAGVTTVVLIGATFALFQNCSPPDISSGSGKATQTSAGVLAISPDTASVPLMGTLKLAVSGGTPPYAVAIAPANCGSYNSTTSIYSAPSASGTCLVTIVDAKSGSATATVTVGSGALGASFTPQPAVVSANVSITATGGTPPYSYTLISGAGTLNTNVYSAPAAPETAAIKVTDSAGAVFNLSIAVGTAGGSGGSTANRTIFVTLNGDGDSLYSDDENEGPNAGYDPLSSFKMFTAASSSRTQFYRCLSAAGHSLSATCTGATKEGAMGYLENSKTTAAANAVVACSGDGITFYTSNKTDCTGNGYTVGATLGWAP